MNCLPCSNADLIDLLIALLEKFTPLDFQKSPPSDLIAVTACSAASIGGVKSSLRLF